MSLAAMNPHTTLHAEPAQAVEATRLTDGTPIEILAGNPSADELAAVVSALDRARTASSNRRPRSTRPRWRQAARLEGTGTRLVTTPGDLGAAT